MFFGKTEKKDVDAPKATGPGREEEGWEVVKPAQRDQAAQAKVTSATNTVDVGTSTENNFTEELLAPWDINCMVETGTKGYYFVKRNIKAASLLFVLGVFCAKCFCGNSSNSVENSIVSSALLQEGEMEAKYGHLIATLQAQIEDLDKKNQEMAREMTRIALERGQWRSSAVGCDQDLRELTASHSQLDTEIKRSKSLAPAVSVTPARHNFTSMAASVPSSEEEEFPVPSPARKIPFPQLALPEPEPMRLLPKPSMKMARKKTFSAVVVAPSVAMTAA
mmetsp:Transcript_59854/g.172720  ORF Transcript_59854/g.172720 Transcript_59854/m.172720 type:complete len:278 (-) Transcript_59854:275-1108(-)